MSVLDYRLTDKADRFKLGIGYRILGPLSVLWSGRAALLSMVSGRTLDSLVREGYLVEMNPER